MCCVELYFHVKEPWPFLSLVGIECLWKAFWAMAWCLFMSWTMVSMSWLAALCWGPSSRSSDSFLSRESLLSWQVKQLAYRDCFSASIFFPYTCNSKGGLSIEKHLTMIKDTVSCRGLVLQNLFVFCVPQWFRWVLFKLWQQQWGSKHWLFFFCSNHCTHFW